ncbi:MAG: tagaturonate epimerase family protein [Isosphaeraceae bacterium]
MSQHDESTCSSSCVPLGLEPSFGFGDRTGLATPGHVSAMTQAGRGILPIFPQQSIREMHRTGRTPRQVMDDALAGMRSAGWTGRTGADADHLKTTDDIDVTLAVGFTFFTIDPSGHVDRHADDYDEPTLRARFGEVAEEVPWIERYRGQTHPLATGSVIRLDEQACLRAAVKDGRAINQTNRARCPPRRLRPARRMPPTRSS